MDKVLSKDRQTVRSQFQGNAMGRPRQELLIPPGVNVPGGRPYSSSYAEARYDEHLRRIKSGGGCGAEVTTLLVMDYGEQILEASTPTARVELCYLHPPQHPIEDIVEPRPVLLVVQLLDVPPPPHPPTPPLRQLSRIQKLASLRILPRPHTPLINRTLASVSGASPRKLFTARTSPAKLRTSRS